MHTHASLLAIAPLVLLARADMDFDLNDAPRACQDICRPIADLSRSCEVDLPGDDNDREEDQLEAQCFCSNDSFEVNSVAAQCQDCVRQERESARNNNNNNNDGNDTDDDDDDDDDDDNDDDYDDAWEDINAIVRTCGFSSTTYMASATETAAAITVTATRPTDAAQLTTTFTAARETGQSNNNNDNNDNNDDNDDNNDNNDDGGDNAAGALAPYWMAGAIVAGAVAMMA